MQRLRAGFPHVGASTCYRAVPVYTPHQAGHCKPCIAPVT
nr:MAG TPA: hypothetical protein [Caudoviricetes sp.]DAX08339.1 MAG TPA: hypothetical protein [Bacteriophage sp.]